MDFDVKSVAECYRLARRDARAYQRLANKLNKTADYPLRAQYLAARDAADRIALTIRFGKGRGNRPDSRS